MGDWWAESEHGYRVAISRHGDGFLYQSYGPPDPDARRRRQERYALGEHVPREREYLGLATSADEAKAICDAHWRAHRAAGHMTEGEQA